MLMSLFTRLLLLLALLMLVLPAPLKAACCPDPGPMSAQTPKAPPCHGNDDADRQAPPADHAGCDDGCCPCRAPAHVPVIVIVSPATLPSLEPDRTVPGLEAASRIPPLPPPIA
jgi:hypothetical protein